MLEKLKIFIKDNALEKVYIEYFKTLQHAEYYVSDENKFMNKSLEIICQIHGNSLNNNCK